MRIAIALLAALPSLALAASDLPRALDTHMAHGPTASSVEPVLLVQNDAAQPADISQAAAVMAVNAWQLANLDRLLPRRR